ncbi:MAG: insulinase family protein [Gemmatimonadota bacterium]|nr:insulinase family protein [Gemmatimonadota bacterium]
MQIISRIRGPIIASAIAAAAVAAPLAAQKTVDYSVQPTPGALPAMHVPKWTHSELANGAELVVTEKHDLPLVAFTITFVGGAYNYESADKIGVGPLTAQMLSEGTTSKTGEQLADAQQMLGTQIFANVGNESGAIGFTALKAKLEPALALVADMLVNPALPADALERLRGRRLVSLQQRKDQPEAIASNVFARTLYGDAHPYGRVETEKTVRAITREDIVEFQRAYYQPGRAVIAVTGDIDPATARAMVEKAFAQWKAGGARPTFDYPAVPAQKSTTIYLVDMPAAAQSVFSLGMPGPERSTPDYYAIEVMNNILGGLFQSRINHNIREVKGYSYGVGSGFAFGRGPGAFEVGGGIVTAKTDSALIEFMKELKGVQGGVPFTEDEIKQGKESLIQSIPRRFASVNATGSSIAGIYVQDLPETYYRDFAAKINAVTAEDLVRVAKKYIDLAHLNIVIVGDKATVEAPLRATGIAPVAITDAEAKPVIVP